jgi:hypothetical protein
MNLSQETFNNELLDLREQLKTHKLYKKINSIETLKLFMENHVYAVWDFMSLLKSLQMQLTCVRIPWIPSNNPFLTRLINDIVFEEESDLNESNQPKSHFEMYLEAMCQIGANTQNMNQLINFIKSGKNLEDSLNEVQVHDEIISFLKYTFQIISTNEVHKIASAFAFGREDIIPDMFIEILKSEDPKNKRYNKFRYYLNRHIELDGDKHGLQSIEMVFELCNNNQEKLNEALHVAKQSIKQRLLLWDHIAVLLE